MGSYQQESVESVDKYVDKWENYVDKVWTTIKKVVSIT